MAFSIAQAYIDLIPQVDDNEVKKASQDVANKASSGLDGAQQKMSSMGSKFTKGVTLPIVGAAAALGGLATKAASNADAIVKNARAAAVSTDTYQELEYALGQAGLEQGQFQKILERNNQRLGRAAEGNEKYAKAYDDLGVSIRDANGNVRDSEAVFEDSLEALAAIEDPAIRAAKASEVFGTKAGRELATALDGGSDSIAAARQRAHDLGIVMGEDSLDGAEAFNDGLDDLKRSFGGMVMEIGSAVMPTLQALLPVVVDTLVPAFQSFAEKVASIVDWFTNLSPGAQKVIMSLIGLVAAIGPVLSIGAKFITLFMKMKKAFVVVKGAFIALKAAMMANPFVLIIAAVVALVIIIVKNWDTIKKYLKKAWNWIKDIAGKVFNGIKDFITGIFEGIRDLIENVWDGIKSYFRTMFNAYKTMFKTVFNVIKRVITTVFNAIKTYFTTVFNIYKRIFTTAFNIIRTVVTRVVNGVKNVITGVFNFIKTFFSRALNFYRSLFTNAFNAIKNIISRVVNTVRNIVTRGFNRVKSAISNALNGAISFVRGIPGRILSALGSIGSLLYNSGKSLIMGLVRGIKNAASAPVDAIKGVVSKVRSFLPFSPAEEGPFSGKGYTLYSGEAIAGDLGEGIMKATPDAVGAAETLAKNTNLALNTRGGMEIANARRAAPAGGTEHNEYNFDVTIPARDLKEMKDVSDFFDRINQTARAGVRA